MKAVIMAGGKGTRLRPLTCTIPKPMVPLLDRPVMEYAIELLKRHSIEDIAVTVQYLPQTIRHHFGDGGEYGVRLSYFEEDTPLGTAGSVKNAEAFLDETFVVMSGDALTDFDLSEAVAYHKAKKALATVLLARVNAPLEFGVVMTKPDGEIVRFLEKPSWGEVFSDTVNTGIYILDPEIFQFIDCGVELDFSKDLFPLLMKMGRPLYGYVAGGYWSDIGNPQQYRQTQFDMLEGKVDVSIRGTEILPQVWIGDQVKIQRNIVFSAPAYIGRECVLEDDVHVGAYSVIGEGCLIKRQACVERTVLWKRAVVEQRAEIKGAVLGRRTLVRSGAVVLEGAIVGDASHIGIKSFVQPGMKVWPNKTVDNYTRLNESLIYADACGNSLFGRWGVKGDCCGGMTTTFAHKLALAFGTLLPAGGKVVVGHDASPYAALIAGELASGMHASGLSTYGLGAATPAATRYGAHHLDCAAGLHVRRCPGAVSGQYVIEFLDQSGLPIGKAAERKVENAFAQEDSRRVEPQQVGIELAAPDIVARYMEHMLSLTDARTVGDMRYTVVVQGDFRSFRGVVPDVLERLGCRVVHIGEAEADLRELSRSVRAMQADLGVSFETDGRLFAMAADDGELVSGSVLEVLQILLQLRRGDGALYVPVHIPGIVEGIGEAFNRRVIRTKADVRSIMEGCQQDGLDLRFDGVFMLLQLLDFMADEGEAVNGLIRRIPRFAMTSRRVECPWHDKGRVMRYLLEEAEGEEVELIDGIKVFHEGGWTLVLPDGEEPYVQVFAHSLSPQKAEELAHAYARKIESFRQKTTVS